jgi:hypothetical protein
MTVTGERRTYRAQGRRSRLWLRLLSQESRIFLGTLGQGRRSRRTILHRTVLEYEALDLLPSSLSFVEVLIVERDVEKDRRFGWLDRLVRRLVTLR